MPTNSESSWGYNAGGGVDVGDYSGKSILFDHVTANNTSISRTTSGSDGNRKMWTQSVWVKKLSQGVAAHWECSPFVATNDGVAALYFDANDFLESYFDEAPSSGREYGNGDINARKHRDPSAWMHIVWTVDAANTVQKVYINGVEETIAATSTLHPMNVDYFMNKASTFHVIGIEGWAHASAPTTSSANQFLVANFVHLDGTFMTNAAAFTDKLGRFSPDTGEGVCIDPVDVTYGTHGFWLKFDDNTNDSSGNSNTWTNNNSCPFILDTPVNNFATLNPLWDDPSGTYAEGNLKFTPDSNYQLARASCGMTSGVWLWEQYISTATVLVAGIAGEGSCGDNSYVGYDPDGNVYGFGWSLSAGVLYGAAGVGSTTGASRQTGLSVVADGSIVTFTFDADNGVLKGYDDGTLVFTETGIDTYAIDGTTWFPATSGYGTGDISHVNFGQNGSINGNVTAQGNADGNGYGDFTYIKDSALALCTANLPDIEIGQEADDLSHDHFNTRLYTGTGSSLAVTGVGFSPDLVWLKSRATTDYQVIFDTVRGATKYLRTVTTAAEATTAESLKSFDADGFTLGTNSTWNASSMSGVSWNWLGGASTLGTGDFTQGSLASTCSRNVDSGFSIVSYTGTGSATTVGHGLSSAPELIIAKDINNTNSWLVLHMGIGATKAQFLDLTAAADTDAVYWNNTAPTSTVFSIGTNSKINSSSQPYIAYCWHGVDGYSSFGSYTGNGSTDGTFIYTGFEPAWVVCKRTDTTGAWEQVDNKRTNQTNPIDEDLLLNADDAEYEADRMDFVSNGFKLRTTSAAFNASGGTYIFMAFSSGTGFKYGNAI